MEAWDAAAAMAVAEARHRRELAFIGSCSDLPRLRERMGLYSLDLDQARTEESKAGVILAEHLLDVGAKRLRVLTDAAQAKEREPARRAAVAYPPARRLPPPVMIQPASAPPPRSPPPPPVRSSRPPPPRWTPPPRPHLAEPTPRIFTPPTPSSAQIQDDDDFFDEPPRLPPLPVAPQQARPAPSAPAGPAPVPAAPAPVAASEPPQVLAPAPTAPLVATAASPRLTGRDLAEFRARKGLTLREVAELLGSLSGTLSKAISAGDKPLSEKLDAALKASLNG